MDVAGQVVIGEMGRQLEQVLLLADLVRFLLMRGLGVLLEVGIIFGLEPPPHVDQMSVEDRGPHPGTDVPVLDHSPLKQGDIHDLPDKWAAQGLDPHGLDPLLDHAGNLLRQFLVCALEPVKCLYEARFFYDLPDDALTVPLDNMPVRGPHGGHRGDEDTVKG